VVYWNIWTSLNIISSLHIPSAASGLRTITNHIHN